MRHFLAVLLALTLAGCAEQSQQQEVNVWPSARPATDATTAAAKAWLEEHGDALPARDRRVYQLAVVLATSRDKDSWQARLMTRSGIRAVVSDYCTDPSVADLEIVAGDAVRWYDRPDGEVTVGAQDGDGFCDHLAIMQVVVPGAVGK